MSDEVVVARDDEGREIVVSQGIGRGPRAPWLAFRRKPSGALSRLRSVPLCPTREAALRVTKDYVAVRGWSAMMPANEED